MNDFMMSSCGTESAATRITEGDTQHQQSTFGTNTETYDLNGNLSTVTDTRGTATYSWNARNQLIGISATGFAASFTYDSFGRWTGRTVQGVVTNFVYDGLNPVQEKAGSTVTANLLTGLGIDEFFQRTDGVGTSTLLPDALGSTVPLGDITGTLQTQYTYEPFGYATTSGAASASTYKYTGREDDGSGLYYYRARYYHPRLQRFIAEDPIGFYGGGTNFYAYVLNMPTNVGDPRGLRPCKTELEALFKAIDAACKYEQDREYGGYIYLDPDGGYGFTWTQAPEGGRVELPRPRRDQTIVAAWHTNPKGSYPGFTPGYDTEDGRRNYLGLPGCSGIIMYDPDLPPGQRIRSIR